LKLIDANYVFIRETYMDTAWISLNLARRETRYHKCVIIPQQY